MSLRTLLVSCVLLIMFVASPASANDPNRVFKGRIMMSSKRFPLSAKSKAAYTAAIRKQSQTNFQENKENHSWKIYFAAFLKKPLNDVEYVVKFSEVGRGNARSSDSVPQVAASCLCPSLLSKTQHLHPLYTRRHKSTVTVIPASGAPRESFFSGKIPDKPE